MRLPEDPVCPCTMAYPSIPSNGSFGTPGSGLCFCPPKVNLWRASALVKLVLSTDSGSVMREVIDLCLPLAQDRDRLQSIGLVDRVLRGI